MRGRPALSLLAPILVVLATLVGCGSTADRDSASDAAPAAPAEAFPVSIKHTFGDTTVQAKPERVVVLGWSAQDVVYALGVTPVGMPFYAYGGGEDGVLPWNDKLYDASKTTLLDVADGPPLEKIAALRPDVILAPYEGFEESVYQDLNRIAPTVAYSGKPWTTPWQEQTRMIGQALGMSDKAEQLIADVDESLDKTASEHPEFRGRSFAYTLLSPDTLYLSLPSDPRVQLLESLGLVVDPSVEKLGAGSEGEFFTELSQEKASEITADILVSITQGLSGKDAIALPAYARIPAIQRNAAVILDDQDLAAAFSMVSVLTIPWFMDQLVGPLSTAAENAPPA